MVRAKFRCVGSNEGVVTLYPVMGGSEENNTFWKYTPSGQITMMITNPEAINQFEAGKEYYVDFTAAE